jgi:hypothetical protein
MTGCATTAAGLHPNDDIQFYVAHFFHANFELHPHGVEKGAANR